MDAIWGDARYVGRAFVEKARSLGFKPKDIKEFIVKQEGYQRNKDQRNVDYFPIWGQGAGSYQADLMFVKKAVVLCVINVNSRFAYAYQLQTKESKHVAPALDTFIKESRDRSPCVFLQTDNGSEFLNKRVQKVLADEGVTHTTVEAGDHRGQGMVERFNQTLRRLIRLWIDTTDLPWRSVLLQLVENYNNRYHRSIMMAPTEADDSTGMFFKALQYEEARRQRDKFKVGDTVRKQIHKEAFEKGRVGWSKPMYEIEAIKGNRFVLSDGSVMRHYELQIVPKDTTVRTKRDTDKEAQAERQHNKKERAFKKSGLDSKAKAFDGGEYVGRRIRKKFEDGNNYEGVVSKYDSKARGDPSKGFRWKVAYDDGDSETMSLEELNKYMV